MIRSRSLLIENGRIRTLDRSCPEARWILVERGVVRRLGIGTPLVTGEVRRFDLRGRTLIPAFCDAHVHLTWLATSFLGPDLSAATSLDELLALVSDWKAPGRGQADDWIVGDGFDESVWEVKRPPTRQQLDGVESRRPILVKRVCGHVGVVNSRALALLTPGPFTDPESGRIAESDLAALNDRLRPAPEKLAEVFPLVVRRLHEHGITAVHDVASPQMLRALQMLHARAELVLRVSCSLPTANLEALAACGLQSGFGDARLRVLGIKIFVDGSLGARTAWLRAPYADDRQTRGTPLHSVAELTALARAAERAGLQLMVHAIGDAALARVLESVEPLLSGNNPLRHRVEHVEVTPPDLVEKLAASGLYACVQPNFAGRWSLPGAMNEQRLGDRLSSCNAYRSLLRAGVPLGFGSDCMPLGPFFGLRSAVEHPVAAERLAAEEAVELYTSGAAALVHAESMHGRLRPGMYADLAVLSGDPFEARTLAAARVEATFLEGELVFERAAAS